MCNMQEVDIATTDVVLYLSLFSRFDVSIPLYTAGTAIITPWPNEESRLLAPTYPFQPTVILYISFLDLYNLKKNYTIQVWLVLFVMLLTMALVFTIFPGIWQKVINTKNDNQQQTSIFSISKLSDRALSIVANITAHSGLLHFFSK